MQINQLFFQLFKVNSEGQLAAFLGTAFAVRPNGGLLTCRHVVDVELQDGESVCVLDEEQQRLVDVTDVVLSSDPTLDACYLPDALQRRAEPFFPILPPPSAQPCPDRRGRLLIRILSGRRRSNKNPARLLQGQHRERQPPRSKKCTRHDVVVPDHRGSIR